MRTRFWFATAVGLFVAPGCDRRPPPGPPVPATRPSPPATVAAAPSEEPPRPIHDVSVLDTLHFTVTIIEDYAEGDVEHDGVTYHGVSKRTGGDVTLHGSTYHTHTKDGTPGRFLGYRFANGDTNYVVLEEGRLLVHRGDGQTLVDEVGTWQHPRPE